MKEQSIRAHMTKYPQYANGSYFDMNLPEFPDYIIDYLKGQLTAPIISNETATRQFRRAELNFKLDVADKDAKKHNDPYFNAKNLKKLGYKGTQGSIFRDKYQNVRECVESEYLSKDFITLDSELKDNVSFMRIFDEYVDNGMYLYSTDGRYKETCPLPMDITINETGVQYIRLNPIISQVARFTFEISKGEGVYELEPLEAGIEISGIQNTESGVVFNWCSEHISDTLEMKYGDKRAMVTIPGSQISTDAEDVIRADIGVLPTYALQNSIAILLNLAVNGVPTQYMTLLSGMKLMHGHSYNIKWSISVKDGQISVMTWQNQSWTADLTPVPSGQTGE